MIYTDYTQDKSIFPWAYLNDPNLLKIKTGISYKWTLLTLDLTIMEVDIALFLGDALGFPFSVFTFALLSAEVLDFFSAITTPGLVRDEVEGRETPVEPPAFSPFGDIGLADSWLAVRPEEPNGRRFETNTFLVLVVEFGGVLETPDIFFLLFYLRPWRLSWLQSARSSRLSMVTSQFTEKRIVRQRHINGSKMDNLSIP